MKSSQNIGPSERPGAAGSLPPSDDAEAPAFSEGDVPSVDSERDRALLRAIAQAPPRWPRSTVAAGTRWGPSGRYIIERHLGRGGMGTVYAATDTVLHRVVALKVLDAAGAAQDAAHHARMLREAQLAARMEHERIARVYDVGTHEGFAFVAMEYVAGGTLRQWMSNREVPVPELVDVASQIAEGLAELHAKGVIHRDLKPENVMLTAQGGVKLLDFGLARNTGSLADESGVGLGAILDGASVGAVSGTPGYMAPEQCARLPIDARVDVFSLGVIIHELVTGERLFRGTTAGAIMLATLRETPVLREAAWVRVPERLRDHTARMLANDPGARFADGSRVLTALRELAGEMSRHRSALPAATVQAISKASTQLALPPPPLGRGRRRALARYTTSALAVGVIGILIYSWVEYSHRPEPRPPHGMVLIDVGEIEVGRDPSELESACREIGPMCDREQMQGDSPSMRITVPRFFLDMHEVTNEEFARMLDSYTGVLKVDIDSDDKYPRYVRFKRSTENIETLFDLYPQLSGIEYTDQRRFRVRPGHEKLPAGLVSWYGANLFCTSRGKRLPTENEWEAAARGRDNRYYPWGNEVARCEDANIKNDGKIKMSGVCSPKDAVARIVGTAVQDVTPDGIRDLGGNVTEWTSSLFVAHTRVDRRMSAPQDAPRVIRGGSWGASQGVRTSERSHASPFRIAPNLGFRCASDA